MSINSKIDRNTAPPLPPLPAGLAERGKLIESANGLDFVPNSTSLPKPALGVWMPLPGLAHLQVKGDDAVSFLHSQLTNEVKQLPLQQAEWAGYCSSKGRLLASFLLWKTQAEHSSTTSVNLLLDNSLGMSIQQRLSMFVLRTKTQLKLSPETFCLALCGVGAVYALQQAGWQVPQTPYVVNTHPQQLERGQLIALPLADFPCLLWIGSYAMFPDFIQCLNDLPLASSQIWRHLMIQSGIAHIVAHTQEQFVPQMINYELIGGVSFKKGCYPGQEVVARSQYLGKLKRRMARYALSDNQNTGLVPQPGQDVFHDSDPNQAIGLVVNVAQTANNSWELLLESPISNQHAGQLFLRGNGGVMLSLTKLTLPYAIPILESHHHD